MSCVSLTLVTIKVTILKTMKCGMHFQLCIYTHIYLRVCKNEGKCAKMSHDVQNETIKLGEVQSSLTKKGDLSLQKRELQYKQSGS